MWRSHSLSTLLSTGTGLEDVLRFFPPHPTLRGRNDLLLPADKRTEAQRVCVVSLRSHSNFGEGNKTWVHPVVKAGVLCGGAAEPLATGVQIF